MSLDRERVGEALERLQVEPSQQRHAEQDDAMGRDLHLVLSAVRAWLEQEPTEPDYEAAAKAIYATRWGDHPPEENAAVYAWAKDIVRSVLDAALKGKKVIPE